MVRPIVDYKNSRIKQYHKEGRALRTETTINNTRDFGIGKLLKNLPELSEFPGTPTRLPHPKFPGLCAPDRRSRGSRPT